MKKKGKKDEILPMEIKTTEEIKVPEKLIDQVIGQENAVKIIKKAAIQRRHVLLIGDPGTGKSMLAQAMAEIMPLTELEDFLVYPNPKDPNNPIIKTVPAGEGKKIVEKEIQKAMMGEQNSRYLNFLLLVGWFLINYIFWQLRWISDIIYAATLIMGGFLLVAINLGAQFRPKPLSNVPKLLIDNSNRKIAPFVEATGAKAGALFGDVKHDPLQSGGLGTPAHLRVIPGMIHKAHKGVLFIDEIALLSPKSQQDLLTAMQEKKFSITGQSELSSGAMVITTPAPCDFVLVAAGNYEDLGKIHPALRSRIQGYGYEVYMNKYMDDNEENRKKIAQFVAQEVKKDGKIPHFTKEAVEEIILEAKRRAQTKGKLTLKLRELGGLIRAAGDLARERGHKYVKGEDVKDAKELSRTLEQQMAEKYIELTKKYSVYKNKGEEIGRVNGLAVLHSDLAGIVIPIEAEVVPSMSQSEGKVIATGKLGEIAKEAVQNVSAIIKKISGDDLKKYDVHIQFLQTYSGVEGDSASISVATAVISSLMKIPVRQEIAMTGSLSIKGQVLPVGAVTSKILAAIEGGFKEVIVPYSNKEDIILSEKDKKKIKIHKVKTLKEVLEIALVDCEEKKKLLKLFE